MNKYTFIDRRGCEWHRVNATAARAAYNAGFTLISAPVGVDPLTFPSLRGWHSRTLDGEAWERERETADGIARSRGHRYSAWYARNELTPKEVQRLADYEAL